MIGLIAFLLMIMNQTEFRLVQLASTSRYHARGANNIPTEIPPNITALWYWALNWTPITPN